MHIKILGDARKFSMSIGEGIVDVDIAGVRITSEDNEPYFPSFVHSLVATERSLSARLNHLLDESLFAGMTVEEAHRCLESGNSDDYCKAFNHLRFADWGATTDDYLCFLIPLNGKIFATCSPSDGGPVRAAEISPHEIISVIREALLSVAPNAPLDRGTQACPST